MSAERTPPHILSLRDGDPGKPCESLARALRVVRRKVFSPLDREEVRVLDCPTLDEIAEAALLVHENERHHHERLRVNHRMCAPLPGRLGTQGVPLLPQNVEHGTSKTLGEQLEIKCRRG